MDIFLRRLGLVKHLVFNSFNFKRRWIVNSKIREERKYGVKNIPIFLISYNRLSYIKNSVSWLEKKGYFNINIIDNSSTYPPLLEYYKTLKYRVFFMEKNLGHMVFWKDERFKEFRKNFYVVSDPDLLPVEDCPDDFLQRFLDVYKKYPFVKKVGFSLKTDDLPDASIFAKEAKEWEEKYYKLYLKKDYVYYAGIDTTFALYAPDCLSESVPFLRAFRTAFPYQVRHLPWYKSENDITEEDIYYSNHKTNGWWNPVVGKSTPD